MNAPATSSDIFARSAGLPISILSPIDSEARLLFVLAPYPSDPRLVSTHAGLLTRLTLKLLDAVTLGRARDYRNMYRDHYANPRSADYMLGAIDAAMGALKLREQPVVITPAGTAVGQVGRARVPIVDVTRGDAVEWRRRVASGRHDVVVLVWPDAIGLSAERLQKLLSFGVPLYVLNGRRRLFRLDATMRWKIALRRYFAHTRVMELIFAATVWPIAGLCAAVDRFGRR